MFFGRWYFKQEFVLHLRRGIFCFTFLIRSMTDHKNVRNAIPVSASLITLSDDESSNDSLITHNKKRLLLISVVAVIIATLVSGIAKFLVYLIYLVTNVSFYGKLSFQHLSPADNHLGLFVILIPVAGGLIVGLMAFYGSKAIRGHGIPEAMEQILTNQSKIHPSIAWLKPLSSAISIGTGGPFGAEGPIIATGGALGSTIGQLLKITHHERKVLLAAGATAGMAAIFGTPVAGIFLAIELLLFEFSVRSIIPVALACITGAAGHHILFETGPVFPSPYIAAPGNMALATYSIIGLLIGVIAAVVTTVVYLIEDGFEELPVHWALWPAIGGIAVGLVGYFAPRTLGVGYDNITDLLTGSMPLKVVFFLCVLKFISWAIALGSGTSGGTLAPLLTIGGATGILLGMLAQYLFPGSGIVMPLAALVGMAAMFAGASRAFLTSIVFALEATGQSNALLPLLCACTGSYIVSWLMMKNTIMTEKIARRGINTPHSYEADIMESVFVKDILPEQPVTVSCDNTIAEVREWLGNNHNDITGHLIVVDNEGRFIGIVSVIKLYHTSNVPDVSVQSLIEQTNVSISGSENLRTAVGIMARQNVDVLPVIDKDSKTVTGTVSYKDIIKAYQFSLNDYDYYNRNISLKRKGVKILLHGKKLINSFNN